MKLWMEASKLVVAAGCIAVIGAAAAASAALAASPPKTPPKLSIAFGVPPNTDACSLIKKGAIGLIVDDPDGDYPCGSRSGASVSLSLGGLTSYVPSLPSTGASRIFTATAGAASPTSGDPRGYFLMKIVLYSSPAIVTGIEDNVSGVAAQNGWEPTISKNFDAGYVEPAKTSKAFPSLTQYCLDTTDE